MMGTPPIEAAMLAVGAQGGCGFLVADNTRPKTCPPLVITAAHCLPRLPPAHPVSYAYERTYQRLLGPLGEETTVSAECLFVDPISDLAVLGSRDNQTYSDEANAYEFLVDGRPLLPIGHATGLRGQVLTLKGQWKVCGLSADYGRLILREGSMPGDPEGVVKDAVSGSPILDASNRAVGVVSCNQLHPILTRDLPRWFFGDRQIGHEVVRVWERG
jgi:hypothetical protein